MGDEATKAFVASANKMRETLTTITKSIHHIRLNGKGTHAPDCPPCIAARALGIDLDTNALSALAEDSVHARAAEIFMQAYGSQRYGSHGPTRMQWLNLGAALLRTGVALPDDYVDVIAGSARIRSEEGV